MIELAGKRILVVEDEPIVAMAVEDMLIDFGCTVIGPAYSLSAAMDLIDNTPFDAAVLDINLDGERSYPAALLLVTRHIPFAFATGYANTGMEAEIPSAPILEKPYRSHQIENILRHIMRDQTP